MIAAVVVALAMLWTAVARAQSPATQQEYAERLICTVRPAGENSYQLLWRVSPMWRNVQLWRNGRRVIAGVDYVIDADGLILNRSEWRERDVVIVVYDGPVS